MSSTRLLSAGIAAIVLLIAPSALADTPLRVRGTITAIDSRSITVKQRAGGTFQLITGPDTTYADVVPSSLEAIKVGSYIGSAVKVIPANLVAVEIVLVPEGMRAGRTGYYPWDPLPDTSNIDTSGITDTNMTNGSVLAISPKTPALTGTSMTNGIVTSNENTAVGRELIVNLVGNRLVHIAVSPSAPIVQFVPSNRSSMSLGSNVVVWTKPNNEVRLVAIGKGITPPM